MELQCKERVDLFDAIRKSRQEAKSRSNDSLNKSTQGPRSQSNGSFTGPTDALGLGSVPPSSYSSLARPPLLAQRSSQSAQSIRPSDTASRSQSDSMPPPPSYSESGPSKLKVPKPSDGTGTSRSPSPEKRSMFRSTLRPEKKDRAGNPAPRLAQTMRPRPPRNAAAAATLAWPNQSSSGQFSHQTNGSTTSLADPQDTSTRKASVEAAYIRQSHDNQRGPSPPPKPTINHHSATDLPTRPRSHDPFAERPSTAESFEAESPKLQHRPPPPPPPPHRTRPRPPYPNSQENSPTEESVTPAPPAPPTFPSYRKEYPAPIPIDARKAASMSRNPPGNNKDPPPATSSSPPRRQRPAVPRKAVASSTNQQRRDSNPDQSQSSSSEVDSVQHRQRAKKEEAVLAELPAEDLDSKANSDAAWDARVGHLMENLPKGVDKDAAKAIFNEIVIKGDEVHWEDVAGLEAAKGALKEAVVYPFLRPDLFMGLREPARGMLLFGPPGTGKTMLARAVATESHSTFFAISASSLTSKYLGESEKLVRALFSLAKALTPAIIFVDEIDSLLSARAGSGEHEATRRIKTEFLIQWSDLAKAAAGREQADGDASRVLVLAATNLPWAIDEAARRRFVRRQYIPLPEAHVREEQLRRLMSAQKLKMGDDDFMKLCSLTDGMCPHSNMRHQRSADLYVQASRAQISPHSQKTLQWDPYAA